MTKNLFSLFISVFFFSFSAFAQNDENPGYYFDNYNVEMIVNADGTYKVTEHIDAVFTEESHGIFRVIPKWIWVKRDVSEAQDGSETRMMHYKVDIDDVHTSENQYEDDGGDSLLVLRIGSAHKLITGPHSYSIEYTLKPYGDRVEQSDLFFYSVLGVDWTCFIKHFAFKIHFAKPLLDSELEQLEVFTGKLGNNTNYAKDIVTHATTTDIEGACNSINPRSAVTVRVPLREGYFEGIDKPQNFILLTWICMAITAVLVILVLYKELFNRSSEVTKTISFYPPEGCSSADVAVIHDSNISDNALISMIPWLAMEGCITIDNKGKHPILHLAQSIDRKAPDYLKSFFLGMFANGAKHFDTSKTSTEFGKGWLKSKKELQAKHEKTFDKRDPLALKFLCAAILTLSFANCFVLNSDNGWIVGGCTTVVLAAVVLMQSYLSSEKIDNPYAFAGFAVIEGFSALFFFCMVFFGEFYNDDPAYIPLLPLGLLNIAVLFASYLVLNLVKMTDYRRQHLGVVLGLREFIETAEKQQLEHLQAEDEEYFYRILPYAVALGLADKWAKRFEGIAVHPVDWYKGDSPISYAASLASLTSNMQFRSCVRNSVASATPTYSSSGGSYHSSSSYSSGGGGYSGGGFGGGGGGRW